MNRTHAVATGSRRCATSAPMLPANAELIADMISSCSSFVASSSDPPAHAIPGHAVAAIAFPPRCREEIGVLVSLLAKARRHELVRDGASLLGDGGEAEARGLGLLVAGGDR